MRRPALLVYGFATATLFYVLFLLYVAFTNSPSPPMPAHGLIIAGLSTGMIISTAMYWVNRLHTQTRAHIDRRIEEMLRAVAELVTEPVTVRPIAAVRSHSVGLDPTVVEMGRRIASRLDRAPAMRQDD